MNKIPEWAVEQHLLPAGALGNFLAFPYDGLAFPYDGRPQPGGWVDHPSVWFRPDTGQLVMAIEPYQDRWESSKNRAYERSVKHGWQMAVVGSDYEGAHFPGSTVLVLFKKPLREIANEVAKMNGWLE